jgi:hypothetical protein
VHGRAEPIDYVRHLTIALSIPIKEKNNFDDSVPCGADRPNNIANTKACEPNRLRSLPLKQYRHRGPFNAWGSKQLGTQATRERRNKPRIENEGARGYLTRVTRETIDHTNSKATIVGVSLNERGVCRRQHQRALLPCGQR